jgi:hypothetical protein
MRSQQLRVSCECTPVVDARYDEGDLSPAEVVIEALAEATGRDSVELPPLYDFIDPDALDTFCEHRGLETSDNRILSFTVGEWNIFVGDDGRIRVCDATRHTEPKPVFAPQLG